MNYIRISRRHLWWTWVPLFFVWLSIYPQLVALRAVTTSNHVLVLDEQVPITVIFFPFLLPRCDNLGNVWKYFHTFYNNSLPSCLQKKINLLISIPKGQKNTPNTIFCEAIRERYMLSNTDYDIYNGTTY